MLRRHLLNEKGSMLVEGLIALAILLMAVTAMVPLFNLSSKSTANNKMQTVAYNAATEEIERIKGLDYDDVGITGGSPSGVLTRDTNKTVQGISFAIRTTVKWVDNDSDGTALAGTDADGRDYKTVSVTLTWTGTFGSKQLSLNTVVARESEDQAVTGGNIKVTVRDPLGNPIEDAAVQITAGPSISSPVTGYTDEHGEFIYYALTPSVSPDDYTLNASKTGYVGQPRLNPISTTVNLGSTTNVDFTLDRPGSLTVKLVDTDTVPITTSSRITLQSGDMDPTDYTNVNGGLFEITDLYPGTFQITPYAESYETTQPVTALVETNQLAMVTIMLNPLVTYLAHFEIRDSSNNLIENAQVSLTKDAITIEQTVASGIYEVQLAAGTYSLGVSATGYITHTNPALPILAGDENDFQISLSATPPQPQYAAIRVRTQKQSNNYGDPRTDKEVRVRRSSPDAYYEEKATGAYDQGETPGEILFDQLVPGRTYRVERWSGYYNDWISDTWVTTGAAGTTTNCTFTW